MEKPDTLSVSSVGSCSHPMKPNRNIIAALVIAFAGLTTTHAQDPLPSWNDGPAKQAIVDFVKATTTTGGANFVPPAERIATFDQDGTLWVEQPMYTQVMYCLERVPALVKEKPELAKVAPFSTVLEPLHGDRAAMEKLHHGGSSDDPRRHLHRHVSRGVQRRG